MQSNRGTHFNKSTLMLERIIGFELVKLNEYILQSYTHDNG